MIFLHSQLNPQELDIFLVKIRDSSPLEDINANPFFHLVKPTTENLKKYQFRYAKSKLLLLLDLIMLLPRIIIKIVFSLSLSFYSLRESRAYRSQELGQCKYLYLSHYTYGQDPNKNDIFFGKNIDSLDCFTFFLNHTRTNASRILDSFHKVGKTKVAVNTKSIGPFALIQLHLHQIRVSRWLITTSIQNRSLGIDEKRILFRASVFQHDRSTIANLVLQVTLKKVMLRLNPEYLVLTLEGHAHEELIIKFTSRFFKQTRIIGYQHAPVVPGQSNLFRIVSILSAEDFFLTSGETIQLLALSHGFRCKVEIIGSLKGRPYEFQVKETSLTQVLVAPEGTRESLIQFVSLINYLVPFLPKVCFTLRMHPALGDIGTKIVRSKLVPNQRVAVSSSPLAEDLKKAHLVIFRSSSLGIEGLSFGAIPIHFNQDSTDSLNPLVTSGTETLDFNTTGEILEYLQSFDPKLTQNEEFQKSCYEIFNKYFSRLQQINSLVG